MKTNQRTIDFLTDKGFKHVASPTHIKLNRPVWILAREGQYFRVMYDTLTDKIISTYRSPYKPNRKLALSTPLSMFFRIFN